MVNASGFSSQMTLSQLDYLPGRYKALRPEGDEIDSFLEGGEVELVLGSVHLLNQNLLTIQACDFDGIVVRVICFDG